MKFRSPIIPNHTIILTGIALITGLILLTFIWYNSLMEAGYNAIYISTLGDIFAVTDSLIAGIAFLAFLIAILLQREELKISTNEYNLNRLTSQVYREAEGLTKYLENASMNAPEKNGQSPSRHVIEHFRQLTLNYIPTLKAQGRFSSINDLNIFIRHFKNFEPVLYKMKSSFELILAIMNRTVSFRRNDSFDDMLMAKAYVSKIPYHLVKFIEEVGGLCNDLKSNNVNEVLVENLGQIQECYLLYKRIFDKSKLKVNK